MKPLDTGKQLPGLMADAEFPQPRTRIMIGDVSAVGCIDVANAQHLGQKVCQLVSALSQGRRPLLPLRFMDKKLWIVRFEHAGTGARRYHDVIELLEGGDDLSGDPLGALGVATVIGWLAAAGLCLRDDDLAACLLQQLHGGEADVWTKQVDQAGNEQTDPLRPALHARPQGIGRQDTGFRIGGDSARVGSMLMAFLYATGSTVTGSSFQISRLYSVMVRSVENLPLWAELRMLMRVQRSVFW